ncbi:MAG: hypothetical protein SFU53_04010, partial [Terrimicrobiaceae bacterium]|nr:hypothetical protein [Terrimicrobiaceae bacterium]
MSKKAMTFSGFCSAHSVNSVNSVSKGSPEVGRPHGLGSVGESFQVSVFSFQQAARCPVIRNPVHPVWKSLEASSSLAASPPTSPLD